ncbi:hypothetical protein QTP88_029041 [Uroleucon formosanum]
MQSGNSIIFYSGLQTCRHEKGVGFVIDKAVMTQVKTFVPVNERICYIRISHQKLDLIILNCYAPTENADDEEKNSFYDTLERTFDSLPKNSIKLIVGDLNAQVDRQTSFGETIGKESWHAITNDNGHKIVDFCSSKDLIISSTYFPRKNIYKHTWSAPDGKTKSQIDHIIIDKRHKTSIRNIRSYREADRDTDHYCCNVCTKAISKMEKKYSLAEHESDNVTLWSKTKESLIKAAERLRGKHIKQNKKHWFNLECQVAINKRSLARQNMMLNPTPEKRQTMEKYYEFDKDLHTIFIDFKQAYDSVDREQLWIVLHNFGLPKKLVNLIKSCNSNTTCKVRFIGRESGDFEVKSGLKQGDALSPILFNIALERVVRDMHETREMDLNGKGTLLAYADDIVILGDS